MHEFYCTMNAKLRRYFIGYCDFHNNARISSHTYFKTNQLIKQDKLAYPPLPDDANTKGKLRVIASVADSDPEPPPPPIPNPFF